MSRPGELLWDNDGPALRTPPPFFQPFTCSAAGSSTARELHTKGCHGATDDGLGAIIPVHHDDDDDAVPWLHCPLIDDGDSDGTAPLPPEYCAGLLACSSGYSSLHAVPDPTPAAQAGIIARPSSTVVVPGTRALPPDTAHTQPSAAAGSEGVMNFTFFSRPLQRPTPSAAASPGTNPLESTVAQAAATRLRNTPLFSDQRMAWLHPPINKGPPRANTAVVPPPAQPPPAATTDHRYHHVEVEAVAATAAQQQQNARATPATVTTSSVSSGNGDHRSQARRSGHQQHTAECSISPDEDMDDEPSAARRSAARGTKRSRTAEVHNLSERRRRDRINEKMRALQELIPNCNKIDKASMLEEAIEYLKTLQLQVQMMSMGTAGGLCVPPAMLMQMQVAAHHHHHAMAAPFPHLGMSLGFGMLPRFAQFPFPVMPSGAPPPAMAAMPPGAMFGMLPGQVMTSPFGHVNGVVPAEQRDHAPPAADHPPVPVAVAPQSDQKRQHPN